MPNTWSRCLTNNSLADKTTSNSISNMESIWYNQSISFDMHQSNKWYNQLQNIQYNGTKIQCVDYNEYIYYKLNYIVVLFRTSFKARVNKTSNNV